MPDVFTREKRSEIMSKIKSRGTGIELTMKAALEKSGIPFEYQPKLFGRPDFLIKPNAVVFCDSSFWHGRNWKTLRLKLKQAYWRDHIANNRKRDALVTKTLTRDGYIVLRFWDDHINKHPEECIAVIRAELNKINMTF